MDYYWSCVAFTVAVLLTANVVTSASVDVQPSPVATVTEGAVLWLTCTYDLDRGILGQLQWRVNDGANVATVTPTATPQCSAPSEGYSVDCNLASNEVRLEILSPVHGDTYSCTVYLSDVTLIGTVSTQVSIVVHVPSVTFTPSVSDTVTVTPGGSQTYTCVTGSCRPSARIDWYKDGVNVTTQAGSVSSDGNKFVTTSSLTLTGARGDSPATVQCRTSNVDGMTPVQSGVKRFVVEWAPDGPPVISGYTDMAILYTNDVLTLQCRQPGGNPQPTLTWIGVCGGISATDGSSGSEAVSDITITITKGYNQATCVCVSTHPQPQTQDRTQVTFTVHYPPSAPVINQTPAQPWLAGESGTLTCSYIEGFPALTRTKWFRDGLQTGQSTPSITLGPLSQTDNNAGYTCRVKNDFTDIKLTNLTSSVTYLNVEYKPVMTLTPTHLPIVEGQAAQVTCEAVGNPTPTLQWRRGGSTVHTGPGTSLTLTMADIDRSATDNYTCRAEGMSTVHGRQLVTERSVYLLVQFPPDVKVVVPLTVEEGDTSVRLRCQITGEPNTLTSQSWTQTIDQSFITDQFTFETPTTQETIALSEVSLEDTGTYTCTVSNGIADRQGQILQSNSTVLNVVVAPKFNDSGQNREFQSALHEPVTIKIPFYSNPPVMSTADLEWTNLTSGAQVIASINTVFQLFNGEAINLSVKGRTVTFSGQAAVMNLSSFDQSLAGTYTVTVYNDGRRRQSTTTFSLSSLGAPKSPTSFRDTDASSSSITVAWTKSFNGGHSQTFVIIYGPAGGDITKTVSVLEQLRSTYTLKITDLSPNTRYQLNMYAYNKNGNSSLSQPSAIIGMTTEHVKELSLNPNMASIALLVIGALLSAVSVAVIVYHIVIRRRIQPRRTTDADNNAKYEQPGIHILSPPTNGDSPGRSQYDELRLSDIQPQASYESLEIRNSGNSNRQSLPENKRGSYETLGERNNASVYDELGGQKHHTYENTLLT